MLAAELASLANGTRVEDVFTTKASEIFVAEPESKSRRIVIGQIRDLEHSLQMRASPGRRKVAIVSEADRLQPQAANAFLKTLEEPPRDSLPAFAQRAAGSVAGHDSLSLHRDSACIEMARRRSRRKKPSWWNFCAPPPARKIPACSPLTGLRRDSIGCSGRIRENIQTENAAALKRDEARYKNTTDGAWLEDREDYYKALSESRYLQRRARLIETLYVFWSDILRANTGVAKKELPAAQAETSALAIRLNTAEILRRLRRIEELRDHLGRNIQEALALEVALLRILAI